MNLTPDTHIRCGRSRRRNDNVLIPPYAIVLALCVLIGMASLVAATPAQIQPYCSLRDPYRIIDQMFPDYVQFESVVRTIGNDDRKKIRSAIPFPIHFDELGRHTLYLIKEEQATLGFVHVRSEPDDWGMVEMAWGLDARGRILDYRFQRCRSPQRAALSKPSVRNWMRGKGLEDLLAVLAEDGKELGDVSVPVPKEARGLFATVLRNGVKTIAATRVTWGDVLVEWTAANLAAGVFGERVQLGAPTRLLDLLDEEQKKLLLPVEDSILGHSSLMGYSIADEMDRKIGSIVFTSVKVETSHYWTWWAIGEQGIIRAVEISESRLNPELGGAFDDHIGATKESLEGCATLTGTAAAEILILAQGL